MCQKSSVCGLIMIHLWHTTIAVIVLLHAPQLAKSALSRPELSLMNRRMALDQVKVTVRTKDIVHGDSFLDTYWLSGQAIRADNYLSGDREGLFYRSYRKPGKSVFFTNELNQVGGKVVVEVRADDDSVARQGRALRLMGLGLTAVRQRGSDHLLIVGGHADAVRTVQSVTFKGRKCTEVSYENAGALYRMVLDDDRGYEPLQINVERDDRGVKERNTVIIEVQELKAIDDDVVYFPRRVEIQQIVDGVKKRDILEIVEMIEIGRVEDDVFSMPSLGIPVGHPVYDLRRQTHEVGYWNGSSIVFASGRDHAPLAPSSSGPAIAGTLIFVVCLVGLLIKKRVDMHRKRAAA